MSTQKITVPSFYGGMANVLAPHLLGKELGRIADNYLCDKGTLKRLAVTSLEIFVPASPNWRLYNDKKFLTVSNIYQKPVSFQGNEYIIDGGYPKQIRGTNLISTIVSTNNLENVTISGGSSGDNNQYYVSWKNTAGFESPLVKVGEYKGYSLTISNVPTLSGSKVRLYRIGARETNFALISSNLANGALNKQYGDDVASAPSKSNPPAVFKYLQSSKYGLAASADNILYISSLRPDAWDTFSSLDLSSEITGIAPVRSGLMVFTKHNIVYAISGTNIQNIRMEIINSDIGCDSHYSIATMRDGSVVWVYGDDVYMFNGRFTNITRGKYKLNFVGNAVSIMDRYMMVDSNSMLAIDFGIPKRPIIRYTLANAKIEAFQVVYTDKHPRLIIYDKVTRAGDSVIWGVKVEEYTRFGIGGVGIDGDPDESRNCEVGTYPTNIVIDPQMEECELAGGLDSIDIIFQGKYQSGDFYAQTPDNEATFNSVDILHKGAVRVYLFVDNKMVADTTVNRTNKGISRVSYPAQGNRGSFTSVKFEFVEEIYNFSISIEATPIP